MKISPLEFSPEMENRILAGRKICTTRMKEHPVGQQFAIRADNNQFLYRILQVKQLPLKTIAHDYFILEGFESPEEFTAFWDTIDGYPKYAGVQNAVFPLHFFAPCGMRNIY